MSYDVRDKIALVTGANRGIGKAITVLLLKHGAAKVYAAVRDLSKMAPVVEEFGDKIVPVKLDLTKRDTILAAAKTASDVSLVINNAGVLRTSNPLADDAIAALDFELAANVYGLVHIAQAFAPVLKANGGGALVQLNSVVSLKSFGELATYCASKAASYSITLALRESLAQQGTLVVSVHPGPIDTDMGEQAGLKDIAEPPELVGEAIVAALAAGEFHAWPDSMAKQVGNAYQQFAERVVLAEMNEG